MTLNYNGIEYKSGDKIIAKIDNDFIYGKLFISKNKHGNATKNYICHNYEFKSGTRSPDMLGFNYSWTFHLNSCDDGTFELSDGVILLGHDTGNIRKIKIGNKLSDFFKGQNFPTIYLEKDLFFKEYDEFDISDKNGMIKLTGSAKKFGITVGRKSMELKLGRFLTTYQKEVKELMNIDLEYGIQDIEKIHNYYLSYQSGKHLSVEVVSGEKILEGYKRDNYIFSKSSLGGSCMTDQLDFLKIYTQNPDTIQMVIVKMYDKIAGRALLFKTKCGKTVIERAYICDEWVNSKFAEIQKKNGYHRPNDNMEVDVNIKDIELWPYLDTFYFMVKSEDNTKARLFTNAPRGKSYIIRYTDGGINPNDNGGANIIIE